MSAKWLASPGTFFSPDSTALECTTNILDFDRVRRTVIKVSTRIRQNLQVQQNYG